MKRILDILSRFNNEAIVLGAYGCGVFKNNVEDIAKIWVELLNTDYKNHFQNVTFSVLAPKNNPKAIQFFIDALKQDKLNLIE